MEFSNSCKIQVLIINIHIPARNPGGSVILICAAFDIDHAYPR